MARTRTTPLGKELRRIRLEADQTGNEMATRVGVTPSYLSAVETGKKNASEKLLSTVASEYELDHEAKTRLYEGAIHSQNEVVMTVEETCDDAKKRLLASFKNSFGELTPEQVERIMRIIDGESR